RAAEDVDPPQAAASDGRDRLHRVPALEAQGYEDQQRVLRLDEALRPAPRAVASAGAARVADRAIADVAPELHSLPVDVLDGRVGACLRGGDGGSERRDTEHASTRGHDASVAFCRPGVEDLAARRLC